MDESNLIASYIERQRSGVQRQFQLFEDCVVVTISFYRNPKSVVKVLLRDLRSEPNKIFSQDKTITFTTLFIFGALLAIIVSSLIQLFRYIATLGWEDAPIETPIGVAIGAVVSFWILKFMFPPIEFAQYDQKTP